MTTELDANGVREAAHHLVVAAVEALLARDGISQRDLAALLDRDPSSVNRAMMTEDTGSRRRQREWTAGELFFMSKYFRVPIDVFFGQQPELLR